MAVLVSNRMHSSVRYCGSALNLRVLEIRLAPQAIGFLVSLLASVETLHILGVGRLAVGTYPLGHLALLIAFLGIHFAFTLGAQSIHLHGHRVHRHGLCPGDLGYLLSQLLVGVQPRGVRHHVPAQRLLLQTVDQDASFREVRDDEVGLLLQAPDVAFPRLDVILSVPRVPTVQDTQHHTGKAASGLRLPLILKTTPRCPALTLTGRLHLVERPVLRQKCHRVLYLYPESMLGGTQDHVTHIVGRLLRLDHQRANVRERCLYVRLRDELPVPPARVLAVELVRLAQQPRIDAARHRAGTRAHWRREAAPAVAAATAPSARLPTSPRATPSRRSASAPACCSWIRAVSRAP